MSYRYWWNSLSNIFFYSIKCGTKPFWNILLQLNPHICSRTRHTGSRIGPEWSVWSFSSWLTDAVKYSSGTFTKHLAHLEAAHHLAVIHNTWSLHSVRLANHRFHKQLMHNKWDTGSLWNLFYINSYCLYLLPVEYKWDETLICKFSLARSEQLKPLWSTLVFTCSSELNETIVLNRTAQF